MSSKKKRVVWLSANEFGLEVLWQVQAHVLEVDVVAVITLAADSKTRMYDSVPASQWDIFDLPVHRIARPEELEPLVRELAPDLLVMCGWRQMLPESVLTIPSGGVIGFHPTLLPKGRGPAPIINSILTGVRKSGVTMFYVTPDVDAGDIIGQEPFTIGEKDTAGLVYRKVITAGRTLARTYLPLLAAGTAPRIPQNPEEATYFPPRTLRENEILPTDTNEQVLLKIRALGKPYAGAFIKVGGRKFILWEADVVDE